VRAHYTRFARVGKGERRVVYVFYADGKCGVNGGAVVRFAAAAWRRVGVVEVDGGRGDEEEVCAACVGGGQGGGQCEVCMTDCEGLVLEMGEPGGGR